jgi:hypothetical protein
MEIIFELLLEFLLQLIVEVAAEFGLHAVTAPFRRESNPFFAALGYAIFGAALGACSLWLFPKHMVHSPVIRIANLIVTPMVVGLCMAWLGSWRSQRGGALLRIDKFWCGALFALAFAAVRFKWAQ